MLKIPRPAGSPVRFVQVTDLHVSQPEDARRLEEVVDQINRLVPPAHFVVATGDLVNDGKDLKQFDLYSSATKKSKIPWFHVFGNHDEGQPPQLVASYRKYFGPDFYSVNVGDVHLVMLNSMHPDARQLEWLKQDVATSGPGKCVLAFQHSAPTPQELDTFSNCGVRAVFSGHWHSNKITSHEDGLLSFNQPTTLMGGIDGSPASFRLVTVKGQSITSEFRYCGMEKHLALSYPKPQLCGPQEFVASIYDSCAGVREACFEVLGNENTPLAKGRMEQVNPLSWTASLDAQTLHLSAPLPEHFVLKVKATSNSGETWETTQPIEAGTSVGSSLAAPVELGHPWTQFQGNAQRTGVASSDLTLPLQLHWVTPMRGATMDFASPVLCNGRLAIGVKDRDNMAHNGVAILDAKSGQVERFVPTRTMVSASPAFVEPTGRLLACELEGTLMEIDPVTGSIASSERLGALGERWIYSSPLVQDNLAIAGSSAALLAFSADTHQKRWLSNFGRDWVCSLASPSLAGSTVIMGGYALKKEGKSASIYALDAKTGQPLWTNRCEGTHGTVAVFDGKGYATDSRGRFKVIDLKSGKDLFTRQLERGRTMAGPAVDSSVVVVPTSGGALYGFEPATLKQKWVFRAGEGKWSMASYDKLKGAVFSSPVLTASKVFVTCSDGKLYALDKESGKQLWSYDFGVAAVSGIAVSGNALFCAACNGCVYGFTCR